MGFFSKKSKDPNPVNDAVKKSIEEAEQQQAIQMKLVEVRKTKEDIDNDFFDLVTSREVAEKSHKAAQANESKLDQMEQADAANKATGKENVSKLWEMEKDIYIIPGGYAEAPGETNDVPRNNLDVYNRAVEQLARQYKVKTPAEAVETGADQLYPYIKKYVNSLRSAIESGRAMKANACIDMLRYVLNIGYRYEDAATPEKFNERVKKKVEFMENTGSYLLSDIDYYYQLLVNYELEEAAYAQYLEEFDRIVEPYLRDCPPETKEKLNHLGFKRAMRELPAGDDARKYLGILIASESYLTRALMSSLRLEAFSMEILRMRGNIQELVNECKRAFVASGDDFDYNAQFRAMERIRQKNIAEINRLNDIVAEEEDFTRRTQSLLKEAAENEKLALAVARAAEAIEKYNKLQKRNENLRKRENEARGAYIEEKQRLAEERLEEQQRQLEEDERLRRIEEELAQQELENETMTYEEPVEELYNE